MSTTEEGFSSELKVMSTTKFGCVDLDKKSDPSARHAFFEGNESIAIYLDRCLLYLSRNPNFKLVAISSSFLIRAQLVYQLIHVQLVLLD